jgi:hypothetical protein
MAKIGIQFMLSEEDIPNFYQLETQLRSSLTSSDNAQDIKAFENLMSLLYKNSRLDSFEEFMMETETLKSVIQFCLIDGDYFFTGTPDLKNIVKTNEQTDLNLILSDSSVSLVDMIRKGIKTVIFFSEQVKTETVMHKRKVLIRECYKVLRIYRKNILSVETRSNFVNYKLFVITGLILLKLFPECMPKFKEIGLDNENLNLKELSTNVAHFALAAKKTNKK